MTPLQILYWSLQSKRPSLNPVVIIENFPIFPPMRNASENPISGGNKRTTIQPAKNNPANMMPNCNCWVYATALAPPNKV